MRFTYLTGVESSSIRDDATNISRCFESPAVLRRTKVLTKEGHYVVLDAVGHSAGMGAVIDLEGVGDAVTVEDVVQLARVDPQAVLVAHIHGDGAVLAQIADVLVDEGERRIGGPFGDDIRLGDAVLGGKVEVRQDE